MPPTPGFRLLYSSARTRLRAPLLVLATALALSIAQAAFAQTEWRDRSTNPGEQVFHAVAYDVVRARLVLLSGFHGREARAETWEWNGAAWTQRLPATTPPARIGHALVYDVRRGRVVLFGGHSPRDRTPGFSDTWEWDG